jgi:hypothetical protein
LSIIPLHRAVSILIEGLDPEALPAVRLALGDLCRTRSGRPGPQVDREIGRLARAFSKLSQGPDADHERVVEDFLGIYQRDAQNRPILIHESKAFEIAMGHMVRYTPHLAAKYPTGVAPQAPTGWDIRQVTKTPTT